MLIIIPTPLGNLGDITDRVREALGSVDLIACEDTRVTGRLLQHLGLSKPMISYRDDNEKEKSIELLALLKAGQTIGLVTDAGTPAISDPGFRLVRACRKEGIAVTPLPGPCAAVVALSASGLPSDKFLFAGFLPPKTVARRNFFEAHKAFAGTLVLYESCHRIEKALEDAQAVLGDLRTVVVARELTKRFESFYVGLLRDVLVDLRKDPIKGEYVLLIAPEGFLL